MSRKEIKKILDTMGLIYNPTHDFWHFPVGINSSYQFSIRNIPGISSNNSKEDTVNVVIHGGPVSLQGWYMPDKGIERIQIIIQEIFETYAEKRN